MSADGQGTKCRRNIAENYNRLSRVHERYRQTTDRRKTDGRQHIANVNALRRPAKTSDSDNIDEAAACESVPFHPYCGGVVSSQRVFP